MKELKFIHITKTAGTSIENIGIKFNINWGRFHKEYGWWHGYFPQKPSTLKDKYDWFTVVRNPYSRIVSEFYCEWGGISKVIQRTTDKTEFNLNIQNKIKNRDRNMGNHWSEQYLYFDNKQDIKILRFEELPHCFDLLMDTYNMKNIRLNIHTNKSTKIFDTKDLSRETLDIINDEYDNDFTYLDYCKL